MGKPFENITEAGFDLLYKILESPEGTTCADLFFDDPTVDGQVEILEKEHLVDVDNGVVTITEVGRAALNQRDYVLNQRKIESERLQKEMENYQAIATTLQMKLDLSAKQSESAEKDARFARIMSILSLIVSIISVIVAAIFK